MYKKILFTIACAVMSISLWAQTTPSVVKSVEGKTLTLTCTGDVSTMPDVSAPTGNKIFTAAARNGNEYGKVLTNNGNMESYPNVGDVCNSGTQYYLKVYTYSDPQTPETTTTATLTQGVYQFDGTSTYTYKAVGSTFDASGSFFTLTNAGEVASESEIEVGGKAFAAKSVGWIYYKNWTDQWNFTYVGVKEGDTFDSSKQYIKAKGLNNPGWNDGDLENAETYFIEHGYLINAISSTSTLFTITNGNYVKAAGTAYNNSITYYKNVEFASIVDITSDTYSVTSTVINNTSDADKWRMKVANGDDFVYMIVNNGDIFDPSATYVKTTGATAETITMELLAEYGFIEDQMTTMPYWIGISNEIKANGYEKVIVQGGEIDDNVMRCILFHAGQSGYINDQTTLKEVDFGGTTNNNLSKDSWIFPGTTDYMGQNIPTTTLTIPMTKVTDGAMVAPAELMAYVIHNQKIKNIIIPEGYTEIGEKAFMTMSVLETVNYPSTLKKIQAAAFANCVNYKELYFNDGLEFIGNSAFALASIDKDQPALDIPSTVKYIGPCAFYFRAYTDVFFHSEKAPISPYGVSVIDSSKKAAMLCDSYYNGNNGFDPAGVSGDEHADKYEDGYANRNNYYNATPFTIMHYPRELSEENRSTYQDITRDYIKYYVRKSDNEIVRAEYGQTYSRDEYDFFWNWNGGGFEFGEETTDLVYDGNIATKVFGSGLEDTYKGLQKIWPSQGQWMRAFITVANGVNWDGVTEYAPELTKEQIQYFIDDNFVLANGTEITGSKIYTNDEVNAFNATLPNAWDNTTVKEPAQYYSEDELTIVDGTSYVTSTLVWVEATDETEAHYEITDESVEATTETVKTPATFYSQEEINAHNAELGGHMEYGYTVSNVELYAHELSIQAYQGTRRCVIDDGDSYKGSEYPLDIKGGMWWTICVPFDMTKAQVTSTFGEGTQVCKFNKVTRTAEGIRFYFTDDQYPKAATGNATVIEAHVAYMIHPTKDKVDPVKKPILSDGDPIPTIVTANVNDETEGADHSEYRFVGNYRSSNTIPMYSYFYAKKGGPETEDVQANYNFYFAQNGGIKWKPNKCVIQGVARTQGESDNTSFFTTESSSKIRTILGEDIDEDVTGVENIIIIAGEGEKSEVVYNLNGQAVNGNSLQRGIYIKGGKKFMVK